MSSRDYASHAAIARRSAKAMGCADCIHFAPDWSRRADALYAIANASGIEWWANGGGNPYLLDDGRMVVVSPLAWFVEPSTPTHETPS